MKIPGESSLRLFVLAINLTGNGKTGMAIRLVAGE